jgi:DNA-binding MarR family transcriptional regulator
MELRYTSLDDRQTAIEDIARLLSRRSGQLIRLLARHARGELSRGMGGLLAGLEEGPQRITQLAEREGLAQPTVTRMVERLEADGLARRDRDPDDRRIVVVTITPRGQESLDRLRVRYRAVLREHLEGMSDEELRGLVDAVGALGRLVTRLQAGLAEPAGDRDAQGSS